MNKVVLVFGGLGNAKSSVVGLYKNLLHILSSRFDVVAIDPAVQHPKSCASQFQFAYSARYADLDAFLLAHSHTDVAAAFVLTPVGTHLSIIEQVSNALDIQNLLFVVEKPSFSLAEIDKGFNQIIPELKRRGALFYFIDTALVSPSLEALFTGLPITLPDSAPHKIIAIATDNPIDSHKAIQDFRFENRIALLNARKLLNLATSGGGGYGFDMGIHAIAGLVRYLHKFGIEDSQVELKQIRAERINESKLEYTQGAETHLYVEGELTSPEGNIEVVIEAGKPVIFGTEGWNCTIQTTSSQLALAHSSILRICGREAQMASKAPHLMSLAQVMRCTLTTFSTRLVLTRSLYSHNKKAKP